MVPRSENAKPLAHDLAIVRSAFSQVASKKRDLFTLVLSISALGYLARQALAVFSAQHSASIALGVGGLVGFSICHFVVSRTRYHHQESSLAHFALNTASSSIYAATIVACGMALLLLLAFAIGLFWPAYLAAGSIAGALFCAAWQGIWLWILNSDWKRAGATSILTRVFALSWCSCAGAGLLCGAILAFTALPEGGIEAASLGLALAAVLLWGNGKAKIVKFMSLVGRKPIAIILFFIERPIAFVAPMATALWVGDSNIAALVAGTVLVASILINALRVHAYLLFPRQIADWIVSIILMATAMVALSLPFVAPLPIAVCLTWLAMRTRNMTWMIP